MICTFSIKLLSLVQLLLSSGPLFMNYGSHLFLLQCLFPTNCRPFCFSSVMLRGKNASEMMALMFATWHCKKDESLAYIFGLQSVYLPSPSASQSSAKKFVWHSWGQMSPVCIELIAVFIFFIINSISATLWHGKSLLREKCEVSVSGWPNTKTDQLAMSPSAA